MSLPLQNITSYLLQNQSVTAKAKAAATAQQEEAFITSTNQMKIVLEEAAKSGEKMNVNAKGEFTNIIFKVSILSARGAELARNKLSEIKKGDSGMQYEAAGERQRTIRQRKRKTRQRKHTTRKRKTRKNRR